MIDFDKGNGIEVAFGGGRRFFLPKDSGGARLDGRDLTKEWLDKFPNSAYVSDKTILQQIDLNKSDHVLGLFNASHMQYDYERKNNPDGEPSLSLMTQTAIKILQKIAKDFS